MGDFGCLRSEEYKFPLVGKLKERKMEFTGKYTGIWEKMHDELKADKALEKSIRGNINAVQGNRQDFFHGKQSPICNDRRILG